MADLVIGIKAAEILQKTAAVRNISETLKDDTLVKPLQFGPSGPSKTSEGSSVLAVEALNAELDRLAKKLARLSEATSIYLENVVAAFDEADTL